MGRTATSFGCKRGKLSPIWPPGRALARGERALAGPALAVAELVGTYER
jgi:hypothetical protein